MRKDTLQTLIYFMLIRRGCRAGVITVYAAKTGALVKTVLAHIRGVLALAFSSNYQYLVSSSKDMTVRIFLWPRLSSYLDITYFEPVKVSQYYTCWLSVVTICLTTSCKFPPRFISVP